MHLTLVVAMAKLTLIGPAEDSLLDISLEEGMDRMDLDELHREQSKRARSINPSISDLRLAVDAAAEMQVSISCSVMHLDYCQHSHS